MLSSVMGNIIPAEKDSIIRGKIYNISAKKRVKTTSKVYECTKYLVYEKVSIE